MWSHNAGDCSFCGLLERRCVRRLPWTANSVINHRGPATTQTKVMPSVCMFLYYCLFLSVCMFVCLFANLYVCLSVCLSIGLSIFLFVCLSVWLSVSLCVCLFVSLCACLSACLSVYSCVCLYVCLSVCLSVFVCLSFCLYVCLSICLSILLFVYLCVCLSVFVCLSVCLSVSLCFCLSVCLSSLSVRICCSAHMSVLHSFSLPFTVQSPRRLRTFLCLPTDFMMFASMANAYLIESLSSSAHQQAKDVNNRIQQTLTITKQCN